MENKYYFLMLEKEEIYCRGNNKEEAFNEIHPTYQKNRTPKELIEFPETTIEKLVNEDFMGVENDVKIMRGIYIQSCYIGRFK